MWPVRVHTTLPGFAANNAAAGFDGTGGYVALRPLNLNNNTVTISGWINANGQQAAAAGLIFSRGAGTEVNGLQIDVAGGLAVSYCWNGDALTYNLASGLYLPDSAWAYVALVVKPTEATIYVQDGNLWQAWTNYTSHPLQSFSASTLIGSDEGFTPARYFNGAIDEVAIFNRALGAGATLYTQYGAAVGNAPTTIFTDPQAPANALFVGDTLTLTVDAGGTPAAFLPVV